MPDNDSSAGSGPNPLAHLLDFGKPLTEGIAKHPFLSAVCFLPFLLFVISVVFLFKADFADLIQLTSFLFLVVLFFVSVEATRRSVLRIHRTGADSQVEKIKQSLKRTIPVAGRTLNVEGILGDNEKGMIRRVLRSAANDTCEALHLSSNLVRSNLFRLDDDGRLRMLPSLTHNMHRDEEKPISMPVGYGSTGRCFASGKPNIAIFREGWGKDVIEDEELKKVHPDLRWIMSFPIPYRKKNKGKNTILVMNVDGLEERKDHAELADALGRLVPYGDIIHLVLVDKQRVEQL